MSKVHSPRQLFYHRLRGHLSNQAGVIRSIVDWTVLLYLVTPGILLSIGWYVELIREGVPEVIHQLSLAVYSIVLIILMRTGCIQLFLHEGDVLFIRSHRSWLQGIVLRGSLYSMLMLVPVLSLGMLILAPLLWQAAGLPNMQIIALWLLSITTGWVLMWVEHYIHIFYQGWGRLLIHLPVSLLIVIGYAFVSTLWIQHPMYVMLAAALLGALSFGMLWLRMRLRGTFIQDVQQDVKKRTKLTELALSQAVEKPRKTRKRPYLFRHSKHLYRKQTAERKLASAVIKSWFRHGGNLWLYVQFTGACIAAIVISPFVVKCLVLLAVWLMLAHWLYRYFENFMSRALSTFLPWSSELTSQAGTLAVKGMLLPFVCCVSIAFCVSAFPNWWGGAGIIPLVLLLDQCTVSAVSILSLTSKSK